MFQELQITLCSHQTDSNNDASVAVARKSQRKMPGF